MRVCVCSVLWRGSSVCIYMCDFLPVAVKAAAASRVCFPPLIADVLIR